VTKPFSEVLGSKVESFTNFETEEIKDAEGDNVPKEKMSIFKLEGGTRIAVRPSGTEPKIKYYLFAQRRPENGKFDSAELEQIKTEVGEKLNRLWDWLQKDVRSRMSK
jgi:phosphoglucomutase